MTRASRSSRWKFPLLAAGAGEMLRHKTAVLAAPVGSQTGLGFLDCDFGGFPNGRRPIDDW